MKANPRSYSAWVLFFILLAANTGLSYLHLSTEAKLWVFLLGVLLPLGFSLAKTTQASSIPSPDEEELLTPIPLAAWLLVGLTGICLRFYQVTNIPWFIPDDGSKAYYSLELAHHWTWHWFFSPEQHPPFFNWLLAVYFKLIQPSLFSTLLFPALLSSLTLVGIYFFSRKGFSNSFGFFFFSLFALSWWPLFNSRFCGVWSVCLFWEMLALVFAFIFWKSKKEERHRNGLILGLICGLGFFATIPWIIITATISIAVIFMNRREPLSLQRKNMLFFFIPLVVCFSLFLFLSIREKNGEHIQFLMAFHQGYAIQQQFLDWAGYITALFWGANGETCYRPLWGGTLNPVLGSLFFMGLVECWRSRRSPLVQWVFVAAALTWTPAIFSRIIEIFRISPIVPFLFFITTMGFQFLIRSLAPYLKVVVMTLLIFVSTGLDLHHIQKYWEPSLIINDDDGRDFYEINDILKKISEKAGPGALLLDLTPNMQDQNLILSTYAFNTAFSNKLSFENSHWVAVMVNTYYEPFLRPRFPKALWFTLNADHYWHDGHNGLIVIPLTEQNQSVLAHWFEAEKLLQPVTLDIDYAHDSDSQKPFMDELDQAYEKVKSDPFLASVLTERMVFYKKVDGTAPLQLDLIERGLKDGYNLPNFRKVKALLISQNQSKKAQK